MNTEVLDSLETEKYINLIVFGLFVCLIGFIVFTWIIIPSPGEECETMYEGQWNQEERTCTTEKSEGWLLPGGYHCDNLHPLISDKCGYFWDFEEDHGAAKIIGRR